MWPGLSPTPRVPRGWRLSGRGPEGGEEGYLCPSHRPVREGHRGAAWGQAARERDGRGRGERGGRTVPAPQQDLQGKGRGSKVEGAGQYRSRGGALVVGRRGLGGVF